MKAYICDKCGKVVLIEETRRVFSDEGIHHLTGVYRGGDDERIDLCDECVADLRKAIMEGRKNENQTG